MSVTSYLAAEDLLVARLQAQLPAGVRVTTLRDARPGTTNADLIPDAGSVAVVYDGDADVVTQGDSQASAITQRWMLIVMVREARDSRAGAGMRGLAGPLLLAVVQALAGYRLASDFTPLRQVAGGQAEYEPPFAAFPVLFTTTFPVLGTAATA